jgi:hypothetical protein
LERTAISRDGSLIVANGYGNGGTCDAVVFRLNAQHQVSSTVLTQSFGVGENFLSLTVALSGNKLWIFVAKVYYVYVFADQSNNGTYVPVSYFAFTSANSIAVDYHGTSIVVGSTQPSYYTRNGNTFNLIGEIPIPTGASTVFGFHLKFFDQAKRLLVSDRDFGRPTSSLGAIFLFQLQGSSWLQYPGAYIIPHPDPTNYLKNPNFASILNDTYFGYGMDISYDGHVALIGAYGDRGKIGSAFFLSTTINSG